MTDINKLQKEINDVTGLPIVLEHYTGEYVRVLWDQNGIIRNIGIMRTDETAREFKALFDGFQRGMGTGMQELRIKQMREAAEAYGYIITKKGE